MSALIIHFFNSFGKNNRRISFKILLYCINLKLHVEIVHIIIYGPPPISSFLFGSPDGPKKRPRAISIERRETRIANEKSDERPAGRPDGVRNRITVVAV